MSGNSILLDSNIVLYLLAGDRSLAAYLQPRQLFLSVVSEMEILSFQKLTLDQEKKIRKLLSTFRVIGLDEIVKEETIRLRRNYALKLPDCLIAATALTLGLPFLTADRQFRSVSELSLELYEPA